MLLLFRTRTATRRRWACPFGETGDEHRVVHILTQVVLDARRRRNGHVQKSNRVEKGLHPCVASVGEGRRLGHTLVQMGKARSLHDHAARVRLSGGGREMSLS